MGFFINELNRDNFLPFEEPKRKLELSYFIPLTVIAGLVFITLSIVLIVLSIKQVSSKEYSNEYNIDNDNDNVNTEFIPKQTPRIPRRLPDLKTSVS
jgi:hypothetical protein